MSQKTVDKHYVSDIDKALNAMRETKYSKSQRREHETYQKIFDLRDNPQEKQS